MSLLSKDKAPYSKLGRTVNQITNNKPKGVVSANKVADVYRPFIFKGQISLVDDSKRQMPIRILRDTGASQFLLLGRYLPEKLKSTTGNANNH